MSGYTGETPETIDLIGSWRLVACEMWSGDTCVEPFYMDRDPTGFIHYLPDGRMCFVGANGGRAPAASPDRRKTTDEEAAASARTFNGYAGPYRRDGAVVVHHLEISGFENDKGLDYVRHIGVEGGYLTLSSPPMKRDGETVVLKLTWDRITPGVG